MQIGERKKEWDTCHMPMKLDYDLCEQVRGRGEEDSELIK